jgi:sensor domain CHASE-containing protein
MRRIVIAALVVALLGAFGLALGLSAADAVERAVEHRTASVERALSL